MNVKNFEKQTEKNTASFQVEVEGAAFEKAVAEAFAKNKKDIYIPGFRKGKAPRAVVEGMYGKDVFYEDGVNEIAYKAFLEGVKETGIEALGVPTISNYEVAEDKTCTISFVTDIYPTATLGEYKGLAAPHEIVEITDADVESEINAVRERNARVSTVERAAAMGDTTVIDFTGYVDGEAFEGGAGTEYALKLGSGSFIPGFEEQLVGCSAGDEKDVIVTFPEDYEPSLAGKEATFKCKVNEVKETELPEIDDEFVKDVSEFDSLEEYKNNIRKDLKEARQAQADDVFHGKLLDAAIENMQVELPESMIEGYLDEMAGNYGRQFGMGDITKAQFVQMLGISEEMFDQMSRPQAERNAKVEVLLRAVAEAEGVEATEEDIAEICTEIAKAYDMKVEDVKGQIDMDAAQMDIKRRKAAELIYAAGTDLPWSEEAEAESLLEQIAE